MRVSFGGRSHSLSPGDTLTFGRGSRTDLVVSNPDDTTVSRSAGELSWDRFAWTVTNTGRRAFFVVEVGQEVEILPETIDRSTHMLAHDESWIRIPVQGGDVAIVLDIPASQRPSALAIVATETSDGTLLEREVNLTDNELRSVVAVYANYLSLPPRYRREPNSYRAAARLISAEEGKVKADLRRVQDKVTRAGGPAEGGSRARDALITWLASRGVVKRSDLDLLEA